MTKIAKNVLVSAAVLVLGLATIGFLMVAFMNRAQAHEAKQRPEGSTLEVSITDAGRVLVRGAEVTAVSGGTISARTEWGASALSWTVGTNGDTNFVTRGGANTNADDIDVGDTVSFSGALDTNGSTFTVDADVVKNWSDADTGNDKPRVEAKAEVRAKWNDWMRGMPFMNFFGKHDNR